MVVLCLFVCLSTAKRAVGDVDPTLSARLTPGERTWIAEHTTATLFVGVDPFWRPIEYIESDGEYEGIAAEFLSEIEFRTGLNFEVVRGITWEDAQEAALSGEIDILTAMFPTPRRQGRLLFTKPYLTLYTVMVTRKGEASIESLEGLANHRLAVVKGYDPLGSVRQSLDGPVIEVVVDSELQALRAVEQGEADAFLGNSVTTTYMINREGLSGLAMHPIGNEHLEVCMAVSVEAPELLGILNKSLELVPAEEATDIIERWTGARLIPVGTPQRTIERLGWTLVGFVLAAIALAGWMFSMRRQVAVRAAAEKEARTSEERFRALVSSIEGAVYQAYPDEHFTTVYMSAGAAIVYGYPASEFIGNAARTFASIIHPDDRERAVQEIASRVAAGLGYSVEYRVVWPDGSIHSILDRGHCIMGSKGVERICGLAVNVTEQRQMVSRLNRLMTASPGVLYEYHRYHDGREETVFMSPAALGMFGVPAESLMGPLEHFLAIIHPDDVGVLRARIAEFSPSTRPLDMTFRIITPAGHEKWIRGTSIGEQLATARAMVRYGVLTDITEHKNAEKHMHDALDQAEIATRAKADFLAVISHEMRTPLNAVINMAQLAADAHPTPKIHEYLRVINTSAKSLQVLINDILDFSRIEAGQLEVTAVPFNLKSLIEETTDAFRPEVMSRQIEFVIQHEPDVPDHLVGDRYRLKQVLMNLVGNAFKFTEKGEVVLTIACEPVSDSSSHSRLNVRFSVRDTGIGIPPEKQKDLFSPFGQLDPTTRRKYGGAGLGLAIISRLVTLMGGAEIEVSSAPGKGSTFSFALPLTVQETIVRKQSRIARLVTGRSCLLIEDNETTRFLMESILQRNGIRMVCAESVEQARQLLAGESNPVSGQFDFLIVDWNLPGTDGGQFIRELRLMDPPVLTPAIITSAFVRPEDLATILAYEAVKFIAKPVKPSLLLETIAELLRLVPANASETQPLDLPDLRNCRVLVAEDNESNRLVMEELLRPTGALVELVTNGREAVARAQAVSFHIILMDVHMPDMDGIEAAKVLREKNVTTPIVALTADAVSSLMDQCKQAGMQDFLPKPLDRKHLYKVIVRLLNEHRSRGNPPVTMLARPLHGPNVEVTWPEGVDATGAMARLGVSMPTYLRLLRRFRSTQPALIEELIVAAASSDPLRTAALSHALAGAAGNIGAKPLEDAARQLVAAAKTDPSAMAPLADEIAQRWDALAIAIDIIAVSPGAVEPVCIPSPEESASALQILQELKTVLGQGKVEHIRLLYNLIDRAGEEHLAEGVSRDIRRLGELIDGYDYEGSMNIVDALVAKLQVN